MHQPTHRHRIAAFPSLSDAPSLPVAIDGAVRAVRIFRVENQVENQA